MPPEQATAPTAPILTGVDMGARIRFLVLRVDAPGWDRAIVHGGAMGMLEAFAARSGFKIADAVEVVRPLELNDFPAGAGPPFLYMTGNGGIEVSDEELLALRDYCLRSGGMLIVDDGGGFGPAFERFMQRVFPGERLVTVAHDDPLFQFPYPLPNGADPLWHHSGTQLKGMRHDGRWALIYHPGDMASAWQPDHSGLSDKRAEVSYDLGVNLIYYAFTQYFQATRQDR